MNCYGHLLRESASARVINYQFGKKLRGIERGELARAQQHILSYVCYDAFLRARYMFSVLLIYIRPDLLEQ